MPNTKSAQKRTRVSERKRVRNKSIRTLSKSSIAKAERLIFSGELESGQAAVATVVSVLDKAAKKGVIHPKNAARRKARLVKKLNEAQAKTSAEAE